MIRILLILSFLIPTILLAVGPGDDPAELDSSATTVANFAVAVKRCEDSSDGANTDWKLPTTVQLLVSVGGAETGVAWTRTTTPYPRGGTFFSGVNMATGEVKGYRETASLKVYCVR